MGLLGTAGEKLPSELVNPPFQAVPPAPGTNSLLSLSAVVGANLNCSSGDSPTSRGAPSLSIDSLGGQNRGSADLNSTC